MVKFASALNDEQPGERTSFFSNSNTAEFRASASKKTRVKQMNQGEGFLGRKLGLPHEAARALSFGANFFSFLKHHFDLVDCSAFWNLEFISLLNSMINVINAVVKFGGNSIFVRKSQNVIKPWRVSENATRIKDERKVALDMEENVLFEKRN